MGKITLEEMIAAAGSYNPTMETIDLHINSDMIDIVSYDEDRGQIYIKRPWDDELTWYMDLDWGDRHDIRYEVSKVWRERVLYNSTLITYRMTKNKDRNISLMNIVVDTMSEGFHFTVN